MSEEENKQFMNSFIDEVINRQNLDAIDEMVSENFIEHVPFPGKGPGRQGLKFAIGSMHTGFPDMNWTMHEQIAENEKVVSRFIWEGTDKGEFMGIPPTNKKVEVWGMVIDVVRDGLFSESRIIMDTAGLLQQLGVIPEPQEK